MGNLHHLLVVEIKAGDSKVRPGIGRFLFDGEDLAGLVEFDDAIALGIVHRITKDHGATGEFSHDAVDPHLTIKDIVTEDQTDRIAGNKRFADEKSLRNPFRFGLNFIRKADTKAAAVPEQSLKTRDVVRRRDNQNIGDPRQHQRRQRIVDHRLVIDRLQLFACD